LFASNKRILYPKFLVTRSIVIYVPIALFISSEFRQSDATSLT